MAPYNLEIPKGPFTTLVADPPWPYKDKLPGPGRGAAKHYDTMSLSEIADLGNVLTGGRFCSCGSGPYDVKFLDDEEGPCPGHTAQTFPAKVANGAHLYLWAPNAFVADAWQVAEDWGFEPKTVLTWVKVTRDTPPFQNCSTGPIHIRVGMGWSFRNCTEHVIVATRDKFDFLRKDVPNVFFAPRRGHSEKPDIFYDIVESMSPGPRLELFAERERPGWTCLVPPKGESHDNG